MTLPTLLLASASPRRRELLAWLGWDFAVKAVDIDETPQDGEDPRDYVSRLAAGKALAAAAHAVNGTIILAADTTVVDRQQILGKPANDDEALDMLRRLRNRDHQVCSAFTLVSAETGTTVSDMCVSRVAMRNYTDEELAAYVQSGDPFDKAGGYGIQNAEFHPVEGFSGCFANVMGLPLCHLARGLRQFGLHSQADIAAACRKNLGYDCPISQAVLQGQSLG